MKRTMVFAVLLVALMVITMPHDRASAGPDEAWTALENLEMAEAKRLFQEAIETAPDDFNLLRGLFLCSCLDMDAGTQDRLVRDMVRADPDNPYLLALFEHVVAEMVDWKTCLELSNILGEALIREGDGRLRLNGIRMQNAVDRAKNRKPPAHWLRDMGLAPGYWITGPFENQSNIAAYRPVPFEGEPLDTLAVVIGKEGKRAGWTWLPATRWGDLRPGVAIGTDTEFACQARCFFELPEDMAVLILPGGACSMRLLVDGDKVYDDPRCRNAVQREGFRLELQQGPHEITAVLGADWFEIVFHLAVLDTGYKPIKGLKWLRSAPVPAAGFAEVERAHPIFDPFEGYIAREGARPDTPYWRAILSMYNGYAAESVGELEQAYEAGNLSTLGIWALYRSLLHNDEEARATERLGEIKDRVSTPFTDYL